MPSKPLPAAESHAHILLTVKSFYESYVESSLPPFLQTICSTGLATALQAQPYISESLGLVQNLISTLAAGNAAHGNALISTAILILTLYTGLRILNYIRRTIMGWVMLGVKLVAMLFLVQVFLYINTYGWERFVTNAGWWGGIIWSFLEELLDNKQDTQSMPRGTRGRNSKQQTRAGRGAARTGWR